MRASLFNEIINDALFLTHPFLASSIATFQVGIAEYQPFAQEFSNARAINYILVT